MCWAMIEGSHVHAESFAHCLDYLVVRSEMFLMVSTQMAEATQFLVYIMVV